MKMMRTTTGVAAACAALTLAACSAPAHSTGHGGHGFGGSSAFAGSSGSSDDAGVQSGEPRPLGNGMSRTYVIRDAAGQPSEVGIRITAAALDGLPSGPDAQMQMVMLDLPAGAADTGFDNVMLDWNPHGHEPQALFGDPHFDMHFYTDDVQQQIDPAAPDFAQRAARLPDPTYVPAGYVPPPGPPEVNTVPFMGLHWTDSADNAIPGVFDFTEVLLNGSWDGRFTFIEPMMTLDWLKARPTLHEQIKQPASYQRTGYHPSTYSVRFDEGAQEFVIALGGMTMRQAS